MNTKSDNQKIGQNIKEKYVQAEEYILLFLLFGSVGAIAWAIRGTSGWGGVDGTIIPGLMWGILWYYIASRKNIDSRGIVLWLGLGIALGGELGYGQYVGWIRGIFSFGDKTISVEPWVGYFWLFICGIGWAAPGGIILGWSLGKRVSTFRWLSRSLLILVLLILLFAWPVIDWLSLILAKSNFSFLFPNSDLGIYSHELDNHLSRTVYTNTQNIGVVIWWIIALIEAFLNKDRITLVVGLILGLGFGIGFMQSALWTLGYGHAPGFIDWWKLWELNSGFNLGVIYVLVFAWYLRYLNRKSEIDEKQVIEEQIVNPIIKWRDTVFLALSGAIILYFVGYEYFHWTGLCLSLFYFCIMLLTTKNSISNSEIKEHRKNVTLIFSIFYLFFIMFHGVSERLGIVLGFYDESAVSQYSWPLERIVLFVPFALVITVFTIYKIKMVLYGNTLKDDSNITPSRISVNIIDIITILGFIGAASIWPAKIGIIYALFIIIAIFSLSRLNQRFNVMNAE